MRRKAVAAGAVLALVAGGAAVALATGEDEGVAETKTGGLATADIRRGDLVDTERVDGELGYGEERTLTAGVQGTVTWAPEEGAVVRRGRTLMRIDGGPVTLMYGAVPMYRTLGEGLEGEDVEQLEKNLRALGYGEDLTADGEFTAATRYAVLEWQEDRGLPETGEVDRAQIAFSPGAVRVKKAETPAGARAPGRLTVTGTARSVHVDLDADRQDLVKKGAKVTVELPGGGTARGRVSEVGAVARRLQPDAEPTIGVEIALDGDGTGTLDRAPVTVELERERRKGVLSVPVEALLALAEGGFGVELVAGGTSRLVAVETGAFGGGRVEISGGGLREGMRVGVPAS
ncbi:peptidoglycan-binding protein [Actinocorallia populi]|uniref:peptidoglycan-binding protein n=1 Tax=Actinocorallia populi TaxID=2079200 RepID=UPI000D094A55|nr:peptidoglycan-binding protein [Actinocorallia populi]